MQKPGDYVPATYAPPAPTAAYEPIYNELQRQIADYVNRTDPQAQAEQDARIQRGRGFWTGANLFANVIANAINAGGTAKGAPSMTFNDAATQRMYTDWQTADRELKADRKAAQQRLDALRLQDAQFRMADKQAQDKAALEAYNRNYEAGEKAKAANWNRKVKEYEAQENEQKELEKENRLFEQRKELARISHSGTRGGSTKTTDDSKYSVWAGGIEIPAKNVGEHKAKSGKIVRMMVDAINKGRTDDPKELIKDPTKAKIHEEDIKNWDDWIALNFEGLYNSDDEFATAFDEAFGLNNGQPQPEGWHPPMSLPDQNGYGYTPYNGGKPKTNNSKQQGNGGESGLF